jgi:hypothetical protein
MAAVAPGRSRLSPIAKARPRPLYSPSDPPHQPLGRRDGLAPGGATPMEAGTHRDGEPMDAKSRHGRGGLCQRLVSWLVGLFSWCPLFARAPQQDLVGVATSGRPRSSGAPSVPGRVAPETDLSPTGAGPGLPATTRRVADGGLDHRRADGARRPADLLGGPPPGHRVGSLSRGAPLAGRARSGPRLPADPGKVGALFHVEGVTGLQGGGEERWFEGHRGARFRPEVLPIGQGVEALGRAPRAEIR